MTRIFDFEEQLLSYLENFRQQIQSRPLNLGGISSSGGGSGGPPGGFVGYLPQTRIAFDSTEAEDNTIPSSGASLLHNLNRIRFRLGNLENEVDALSLSIQEDSSTTYSGINFINFLNGIVYNSGNRVDVYITRSGGPSNYFYDLDDVPHSYLGSSGFIVKVNQTESGLEFSENRFTSLIDTPQTYSGNSNKLLKVNNSEDNIIFDNLNFTDLADTPNDYQEYKFLVSTSSGISYSDGYTTFLDLLDTPTSYSGNALRFLAVNSTETGIVFASTGTIPVFLTDLLDTPDDYFGSSGKVLAVKSDESGIEFVNFSGITGITVKADYNLVKSNATSLNFLNMLNVQEFGSDILVSSPILTVSGGGNSYSKVNNILIGDNLYLSSVNSNTVLISGASSGTGAINFTELLDTPSSYLGQSEKFVRVKQDETGLEFSTFGGSLYFTDLADTPASYSGSGSRFLKVSDNESGIEFISLPVMSGFSDFISLLDTPSTYTTQSGKFVRVNSTETGLEFSTVPNPRMSFFDLTDAPSLIFGNAYIKTDTSIPPRFIFVSGPFFTELQDAPDRTYAGHGGKFIRVRPDEYMLEYVDLSLSGYTNFINLEDTPTTYSGQAGKAVVVNSTEDGLDFVNVSGIGNYNFWITNAPPVSANSYSDEFDDEYFNSSIWGVFDPNSNLNVYEREYGLELTVDNTSSHEIIGVYTDIPYLTDFSVLTKSLLYTYYNKGSKCGVFLSPDMTITTSSELVIIATAGNGVYRWIQVEHYNNYTSYNSTYINHETPGFTFPSFMRLRFHLDYPDLFLWVDDSLDGLWWYNVSHKFQGGTEDYFNLPFNPQTIGFFIRKEFGDAMELKAVFPFFRVYSGNEFTTVPKGRRI